MKRRLSAILLALGLSASVLSLGVYGAETETEVLTEAQSAASVDEAAEALETELEEAAEADGEAESEDAAETTETVSQEEQLKEYLANLLTQVSAWSEEDIELIMESDDASSALIATNWYSVRGELGDFVEVLSAELSEDGMSIVGHVKYEKAADSTDVIVTYSVDATAGTMKVEWEVIESMGTKMQKAALNTVMGLGIVFVTLFFLSWLIGRLHIIPDMIEGRAKKNAPAETPAPAAAPAPVAAPAAVEEEDLTDDLELVAVITAAIAASQTTSGDGFVVRSIKKSNKRNWQRA